MYLVVFGFVVVVSILLVLIVLVQNSKGGGLASSFSSSNSFMGVRKTTDFVEKATWGLVIALLLLSFATVAVLPRKGVGARSLIDSQVEKVQLPKANTPAFPAPASTEKPASEPAK